MFIQFLILILGFALLIVGANALVNGASGIAKKFNIPEILIGLTIVALGTSLPELVVTIISATSANADILVGNVIGSNICNLLLILGVVALLKPLKFEKSTIKVNLPLLIGITILVLVFGLGLFTSNNLVFTRRHAIILLFIASLFFGYPILEYIKSKKDSKESERTSSNNKENKNIFQCIIYIILGVLALKYGGDLVVNSSTTIATMLNIPERVISLTIVALGTSLPELVTSIVAIIKHDDDLAEGNIIGSCIINFCLILGLGAAITNIPLQVSYIENLLLLIISEFLIWLYGLGNKNNTLTRQNGIILLIIYIIYSLKLFI